MISEPGRRLTPRLSLSAMARPAERRRLGLVGRLRQNPRIALGLTIVLGLYVIAIVGPGVTSNPNHQQLAERLQGPSLAHLLGTDNFGRDVLSRTVWGARVSLAVSLSATLLTLMIGLVAGLTAGFFGGVWDMAIMRFTDVFIAFPIFVLLLTVIAIYGSSLTLLIIFLGLAAWPLTARLVRAEVLSLVTRDFVLTARSIGASEFRIIVHHILPNVIGVLLVAATLRIGSVILVEAGLSYFGLGITPPTPSWGNIVAAGQAYLDTAWWISVFPGAAIVMTVMAYNLLGDGLRDALDPQLRLARTKVRELRS